MQQGVAAMKDISDGRGRFSDDIDLERLNNFPRFWRVHLDPTNRVVACEGS